MCSKKDISKIIISDDPREEVLFQGDFGDLINVRMVEGVMLEIHGEKGVFRVDLTEDDLQDGLISSIKSIFNEGDCARVKDSCHSTMQD